LHSVRKHAKQPNISIHILDDDSLVNIFNLCRPNVFEEDEYGGIQWCAWVQERWWYQLVKVCRRWRYLILGSTSHLGLCLVCTRGTPVVDMLAHSPPLPLIIDHDDKNHDLTAEDEEGIMFAFRHRNRVRRIFLVMPAPCLQKLITAMGDQFPMLEDLHMETPPHHDARLALPSTFKAPQLRMLVLNHFVSPIGSPLLTTAVRIVSLSLRWVHPSTNLYPNHLFPALSCLPQLQNLEISFSSPVPNNREIERQLLGMPIIPHIALPNLRFFHFVGVSAYLEALLSHMNAPLLKTLRVAFFNQLSFSVPHFCQFLTATENLRSSRVDFLFYHKAVAVFLFVSAPSPTLHFRVGCDHLDWQVSSMAQIFSVLSPSSSAVVDLTLDYRSHTLSSEWHNQAHPTQWRQLLGSFRNVETLRVHGGLVGELSRCLALDHGEPPSEILPQLKTLVCPIGSRDAQTFARFLNDREVAGLPIDLIETVFPVGEVGYEFDTPAGMGYVR